MAKKKTSLFEKAAFMLNTFNVVRKGNKSARMMLLLQLLDMDSPVLSHIPMVQWVEDYFGTEHPFSAGVKMIQLVKR